MTTPCIEDWSLAFSFSKRNQRFEIIYLSYPARGSVVSTQLVSGVVVSEQRLNCTSRARSGRVRGCGFHLSALSRAPEVG